MSVQKVTNQLVAIVLILHQKCSSYVLSPGKSSEVTPLEVLILPRSWRGINNPTLIFPGTKWCGPGDTAATRDDFGFFESTDACCRDHDYCKDVILSGETKHGLTNVASFTRLKCDCDYEFYRCLSETGCSSAQIIGQQYFNALLMQCYDFNHPAECVRYEEVLGVSGKCIMYHYNLNETKQWQWMDTPVWQKKNILFNLGFLC